MAMKREVPRVRFSAGRVRTENILRARKDQCDDFAAPPTVQRLSPHQSASSEQKFRRLVLVRAISRRSPKLPLNLRSFVAVSAKTPAGEQDMALTYGFIGLGHLVRHLAESCQGGFTAWSTISIRRMPTNWSRTAPGSLPIRKPCGSRRCRDHLRPRPRSASEC